MGVFFALLPEGDAVSALTEMPRTHVDQVRWQPIDQLHVTIRYFSSLDDDRRRSVTLAAEHVVKATAAPTIELGPTTIRLGRDGTVVLPATGAEDLVVALDDAWHESGLDAVIEPRGEPFFGHLTVARRRSGMPVPDALVGLSFATKFVAPEMVLISSTANTDASRTYAVMWRGRFV